MSDSNQFSVYIKTFYNPDLFWFLYAKDVAPRDEFVSDLNSYSNFSRLSNPERGQSLITKYDGIFVRGIFVHKTEDRNFVCWLVDYGVFGLASEIFEMPSKFSIMPPFVKNGKLYGLFSATEVYSDIESQKTQELTPCWARAVRKQVNSILKESSVPQTFIHKISINNYEIGDLYLKNNANPLMNVAVVINSWGLGMYDEEKYKKEMYAQNMESISLHDIYYCLSGDDKNYEVKEPTFMGRATFHKNTTSNDNEQELVKGPSRGGILKNLKDQSIFQPFKDTGNNSTTDPDDHDKFQDVNDSNGSEVEDNFDCVGSKKCESNVEIEVNTSKNPENSRLKMMKKLQALKDKKNNCEDHSKNSTDTVQNTSELIDSNLNSETVLKSVEEPKKVKLNMIPAGHRVLNTRTRTKSPTRHSFKSTTNNSSRTSSSGSSQNSDNDSFKNSYSPVALKTATIKNENSPNLKPETSSTIPSSKKKSSPNQSVDSDNFDKQCSLKSGDSVYSQDLSNTSVVSDEGSISSQDESLTKSSTRTQKLLNKLQRLKTAKSGNTSDQSESDTKKGNFHELANGKKPPDTQEKCQRNSNDKLLPNGHCPCSTCKTWLISNDPVYETPQLSEIIPKKKHISNVPIFRHNTDDSFTNVEVMKVSQAKDSLIDKLASSAVLVHGPELVEPVDEVFRMSFKKEVLKKLKMLSYEKTYRIQSYAWPILMRNAHTFIINGPKTGKTMSYVPVMCNMLARKSGGNRDKGPLIIIICPGIECAENAYRLMIQFMNRDNKLALLIPPISNQTEKDLFKDGVDILVCTPMTLGRLYIRQKVKFSRVEHVVLENCHELFDKFNIELKTLFSLFEKNLSTRSQSSSIQMIAISQKWTSSLERFAKQLFQSPFICIGSYLEAALYGKTEMQIKFDKSKEKNVQVLKILKNKLPLSKSIVICNDIDEINNLLDYLTGNGISCIELHADTTADRIANASCRWQNAVSDLCPVLLCTDDIFNTSIAITDATIVIQYSLPVNWSQFTYRFSAFLDIYPCLLNLSKTPTNCKMYIFVDENNCEEYPKIIQLLERTGCDVPQIFLDKLQEIIDVTEANKVNEKVELCENIKQFGKCASEITCDNRHVLSEKLDLNSNLPTSGLITAKMLHRRTVTSYWVRLIEHTDAHGSIHPITDKYAELAVYMGKLANKENQSILTAIDIQVGSLCAVEEKTDLFRRCKITSIIERGTCKIPTKVGVWLLDTGAEMSVSVSKLYQLPSNLKVIPPHAVEVYIADLGPPDKDTVWSQLSNTKFDIILYNSAYNNPNYYFTGRIKLQLGNTLWVNNLYLQEHLKDKVGLYKLSLHDILLKQRLTEARPEHLTQLYDLCKLYNFPLCNYNLPFVKSIKPQTRQVSPYWAHLDNFKEYNPVYMLTCESPDNFYLQLMKNDCALDNLQKEIQKEIKSKLYPTECDIVEGNCYLVQDRESGDYCRAILRKLNEDATANMFFVDYGDFTIVPTSELKFITDKMILWLPFQIIECRLWGVQPSGTDWLREAADIFYDLTFVPDSSIYRTFYVKFLSKEKPINTGLEKYSVLLVDIYEGDSIINDLLVEHGFAIRTTEERCDVDFDKLREIDSKPTADTDDRDLTESKDMNNQEFDDDTWDCGNVEDIMGAVKEYIHEQIREAKRNQQTKTNQHEFTKMKSLPAIDHSVPYVIWNQTDSIITLRIEVLDAIKYKVVVVRNRILNFRATTKNTTYKLDLTLLERVESKVEHYQTGLNIAVKLQKQTPKEWVRLVTSQERMRNIRYNVVNVPVSDENDGWDDDDSDSELFNINKFNEYMKRKEHIPYQFENELVYLSEFSDSDSDVFSENSDDKNNLS